MIKRIKKTFLILIPILILTGCLTIVYNLDKNSNKNKDGNYILPITWLIMDSEKIPSKISLTDAINNYGDNILKYSIGYETIEVKNGKYNYATVNNVNDSLYNNIMDYATTMHNNNGEIINDIKFDKETKMIKIPKKYFKINNNKSDNSPVQIEFVTKLNKKQLKNMKINCSQKKIFTKKSIKRVNGFNSSTSFSIGKYEKNKGISKKDLKIYVNDQILDKSFYTFDSISGVVNLFIDSTLVNDVDVIYKKYNFLSLKNIFAFDADDYPSKKVYGTIKGVYNISVGLSWTEELSYKYIGSGGYANPSSINWENNAQKEAWTSGYMDACINDNCNNNSESVAPFIVKMPNKIQHTHKDKDGNVIVDNYIEFGSNFYVPLFCIDHTTTATNAGDAYSTQITVVYYDAADEEMILRLTGQEYHTTQKGEAYIKVIWKDERAAIEVTKVYKNNEVAQLEGLKFGLYSSANGCNTSDINKKIGKTHATNSSGKVYWKNLSPNKTYYIREYSTSGKLDANNWTPENGEQCKAVKTPAKGGKKVSVNGSTQTYYLKSISFTNRRRKYCYKVRKVDADFPNCNISGISFTSSTGETQTTGSDGVATFQNLGYGSYSFYESSPNPTAATSSCGGTFNYWNENSAATAATISEMNYDAATNTYSCAANPDTHKKQDHKVYYCLKVKKIDDATKNALAGATIEIKSLGLKKVTGNDGIATFMLGTNSGNFSVEETIPPIGYALSNPNPITVPATAMPQGTSYANSQIESNCNAPIVDGYLFKNPALILNWYKVTENKETKAENAEFEITKKGTNEKIHYNGKMDVKDTKGQIKNCYVYTTDTSKPTVMVSNSTSDKGDVCIRGIPAGSYTITETKPAQYHTFGPVTYKDITIDSTSTTFKAMDDTNKFVNYPTRFEFGKNIVSSYSSTDEGSYKDLTTSELRKLKFNVTDVSGQIVRFKKKRDANNNVIEGEYEYLNNTIDPQGEEEVTDLQLNSDRKIIIWHLPWADASNTNGALYSIKEKVEDGCTDQNQNTCNGNGFYYPEYNNPSDFQFRIYQTSSPQSINKTEPKQSLSNTPTEIKFTKDDIYCKDSNCNSNYQNGTNGTKQDTVFENEEEMKVFDDIQFVLRDSTGRDVTDHLIKVSDNEYRFVKDVNTLSDELKAKLVKTDSSVVGNNIHTKDGTLKITHLCRESTYYIEEYKVPEHTVFILPTTIQFNGTVPSNWNWKGHPYVTYKVSNKESTKKTTPYSDTQVIDNTPTRILIYKKDSKYDYLIPDETTTFQLYRCKKGEECHPTDDPDNTENYERVRFWNRALIPGDKEDYKNDKTGLQTEVYKFVSTSDEKSMSESDFKSKTTYDLHPDHGVLVFRYLPANYNYVLVETVAPKNYQLPVGRNAETSFKVVDNTVQVDEKDLPNKPTSVLIKKYADDGKLLKGAEFKIYEVEDSNVCSKNLSPVNQKKKLLKLKTIRDGVYEARPEGDTDTIVTCSDRDDAKCSDIKTFVSKELTTKLTHDKYEDSWSKFEDESTSTEDGRQIELQEGVALIQYLEYDHCYVIEETKAPEGYSLPELKKRYTTVTIKKNDEYAHDTNKDLINKPTPFKFYKYDEFNKLIDGAEFKLQKLDDNKKYQDVTVTEIPTENGELFYKVDKDTDNTLIKTKGGTATIYYLTAGQYRVVETKAPGNKVLSKNLNLATFFVDENGSVYGNSIIVNRSIVKTPVKNSASAELIVTIQTGQTVIRYGIVIAVLVGMISGLMILKEKKSRKDYNKDEK